tara:strand:+ start:1821 stop:2039 length:219 start_codon:yes stop_codon:yes gene_type:complete
MAINRIYEITSVPDGDAIRIEKTLGNDTSVVLSVRTDGLLGDPLILDLDEWSQLVEAVNELMQWPPNNSEEN